MKIVLSQTTYIDKFLVKYMIPLKDKIVLSKKGLLPFKHRVPHSQITVLRHMRRKISLKQLNSE